MTVIAFKDGIMVGDGRISSGKYGDILTDQDVKVYKIGDYLLGVAGDATAADALMLSLQNGHSPGRLKNAQGMRYSKASGIEIYDTGPNWWKCRAKYFAVGIGDMLAMAVMDTGASALEAVKATCKRSASCGGKITKVQL